MTTGQLLLLLLLDHIAAAVILGLLIGLGIGLWFVLRSVQTRFVGWWE
jgi:hypothetical protein